MQASFRKKYDYGYFYFRGSSHVEEKLQGIELSRKDSILSLYKPENDYAARKLRELKQQTIDTGLLELVTVITVGHWRLFFSGQRHQWALHYSLYLLIFSLKWTCISQTCLSPHWWPCQAKLAVQDSIALKHCNFLNRPNIALTISCENWIESSSSWDIQ